MWLALSMARSRTTKKPKPKRLWKNARPGLQPPKGAAIRAGLSDTAGRDRLERRALERMVPKPSFCEALTRLQKSGAIAQLGERFNGIEEVVGSIPSGSTKFLN